MAKHIITGTAAPVDAPTELGQHFVDTATPAIYFSTGTATVADWKLVQEAGLLGTIAIQDANNVAITGGSITNLTTLELPVSATPAVATDGEIALDTTVADFSHGVIKFYGTEEQGIVSMPIAQFTAPTDGYVVTYNATNDEFVLAAGAGAVSSVNGLTGAVSLNGGYIGVKGADIASAATVDLATATGDWVDVTGTTTITALGTIAAGVERLVRFTGILTLTHNATSLILPTGANITTAAGDTARFRSLGSGNWVCVAYQRASGAALASSGGSLTNWTEAVITASPNATIPAVSFTATNAAASVDAALIPKGTSGALLAAVPDATTTGGDKRGARAVDWQLERNAANQVASGAGSVVGGGRRNRANQNYTTVAGGESGAVTAQYGTIGGGLSNSVSADYGCIPGGQSNTVSGNNGLAFGSSCTASGSQSCAGGSSCTASGIRSFAFGADCSANASYAAAVGLGAQARGIIGAQAYSSNSLWAGGAGQSRRFNFQRATTDATPAVMTANGAAAGTGNQVILPDGSLFAFKGMIVVREAATGDAKAIEFKGAIKRGANAAATALVGTPTQADLGADAGAAAWTVAFTADTTNGGLAITVTGEASHTLRWDAIIETVEVVG